MENSGFYMQYNPPQEKGTKGSEVWTLPQQISHPSRRDGQERVLLEVLADTDRVRQSLPSSRLENEVTSKGWKSDDMRLSQ